MLSPSRVVEIGETPHDHERDAIRFAQSALPNHDPYQLWALVELLDPSTGRLHEIDLLVIGYSAIYLVEIKSGPGRYEGDQVDWYRTPPGGASRWMEPPYRLANHKARVLAGRLAARMKDPQRAPWVQGLVFLSSPEIELRLKPEGLVGVVTRATFAQAITHHRYPGVPADWHAERIPAPVTRDVTQALAALGVRPRKGKLHVGAYELGAILDDHGAGYQDRLAVHRDNPSFRRRARIYLVPQQTSVERRQQLRRAADREAQLLYDVREHQGILQITDYVTDAPVGPTVLLDAFDGGVPLDAFLRRHPELSFGERVSLVEQIGHALAFCHRRGIVHGALGPHAVLIRRNAETGDLQARLFDFQLGAGREIEATTHWSALAPETWSIYQAPELRQDPPSPRSPQSDLYSLGALAYLVFTGRPPGDSVREIDERLGREHHLDPRVTDDGVPPALAEVIAHATDDRLVCRADDVGSWIELLLDLATRPDEPDTQEVDPLEARKDDRLGGDLVVEHVLGHGASSRVLQVRRDPDGRAYALKISLSDDHDARLAEEARVLGELRHPRIVQLIEPPRALAGRTCLLLSLAGEATLQRYLAQEGTVSLDFASRYGEDLLSALEELEERQIVHRDIKPANLGVGTTTKSANHLTLFDFSLAYAPRTELQIGTSAYRDPWLRQRGAWDPAADRWGAAVTLHEMLTGARPAIDPSGAPDVPPPIAAERIDPSVRDRLAAFFERALQRDAEVRFPSAKAMRHAWIACFEPSAASARAGAPATSAPPEPRAAAELTAAEFAAIAPDTPIEALPLSLRARNALDRAGLVRAADLLDLPDNRLNAVRGVGTHVAAEILEFRRRWREHRAPAPAAARPFFPGYRGEDFHVATAGLEPAFTLALQDAGLRTLSALAAAPAPHIEALARRAGAGAASLTAILDRENRAAGERAHPTTLEGWIEALLPHRKKRFAYPRALYGLDDPFTGRAGVTAAEVAAAAKVTRANVYLALGAAREDWQKHPALPELRAMVRSIIEPTGALPLARAADALLAVLPHDRAAPEPLLRARAAALARIAADVERDEAAGLRFVRLHDEIAWLTAGEAHAQAIATLGAAADALAARPVLASPGEAARLLAEAAQGTPFMALPPERLVDLAVLAGRGAARSTRLEIYPRGLPAERALELCAAVLTTGSAPEQIAQRVAARYPDAAPLPPRPELDALLEPHGLRWDAAAGAYARPGERTSSTTLGTTFPTLSRAAPVPAASWAREPTSMAAVDFDDRITNAVDRRALRVLGVTADKAREAALALGQRLGVRPTNLDTLLLAAIRRQMEAHEVDEGVVHEADQEGSGGGAWGNLVQLAELAAAEVARALLPPREPLLLVQPGLLSRYRLEGFLRAVVEASRRDDAAAIFLVVPAHDTGGIPRINEALTVPGILPSQAMWVPAAWIRGMLGETPSTPPPGPEPERQAG